MSIPQAMRDAIAARRARGAVAVDPVRLRYYNEHIYRRDTAPGRVLYIGVGSGFDALLALLDGCCEVVVGVDPFIASDGNGDQEHAALLAMVDALGLGPRFELHRARIEDWLVDDAAAPATAVFDHMVCNQVLHHIYTDRELLRRLPALSDCQGLFTALRARSAADGTLVVGEASRHGLRPWLTRAGLLSSSVDYGTKQPWREWHAAISAAGWRHTDLANYVPWRLRGHRWLARGPVGRYSVCETYFLRYAAG